MPRHDSLTRVLFGWAAVNGRPTRCAAQSPETTFVSQPGSRVKIDQPAGPEPGNNPVLTLLKTARRVGDSLPLANRYLRFFVGPVAEA